MNKWRNPALQTITNHYKPLQTITNHYKPVQTSTNLWKCWCWRVRSGRISETARRHQTSSPSARPMRCSCNPCNLPTLFQNIQNSFNHLIHLIPRVCRVCVTPQLLGYVEDGGRYDAKPNVRAMWCTTSLDIPHYTDVHRCCMLLHATQSYLCLEPRPLLGPSTVWLRSQQSNFNTGILWNPGRFQTDQWDGAAICKHHEPDRDEICSNWYQYYQLIFAHSVLKVRNGRNMHGQYFPWIRQKPRSHAFPWFSMGWAWKASRYVQWNSIART